MKLDVLLFCHVPKTAGTMFIDILRRNFLNSCYRDVLMCADIGYSSEHVRASLAMLPHKCFASHALRATSIPWERDGLFGIAFARVPEEHAISGYFDLRNRVAGPQHPTTKMSLKELTEIWSESGFGKKNSFTFSQLCWLYPGKENAMDQLNNDLSSGRFLLFPTDRMEDSLLCLEKLFPEKFRDCSYGARQNVSQKDYKLSDEDKAAVSSLPWTENDRQLYKTSHEYLNKVLDKLYPTLREFEEAKKKFRKRCVARSERKSSRSLRCKIRSLF